MKWTIYSMLLAVMACGCATSRELTVESRKTAKHRNATAVSGAASASSTDGSENSNDGQKEWSATDAEPIEVVSHQQSEPAPGPLLQHSTGDFQPSLDSGLSTLDSFEQLALRTNPTLMEMQARVSAANGRWVQVGLKPNPVAGVAGQEIGNEGAAGQHGAFVGQQFVTANKLGLNRNAASWDVRRAQQELAAQRLRVLTDVRRGFYSVLVAQERVKVARELHDIAQQAVDKAKELIKVQEPETVLAQAEIEAELAAILVENSVTQRDAQWQQLAAVIGQPDMPRQDVAGEPTADAPQVMWEETLDRIRRESPELAAATAQVEQSRWALQRACVQPIPNVTLQTGVYYDDSSNDPFATFQMSLPIPIHNRNQGGIAEAHANVIAAQQAVQRVDLSLRQRLAAVYQQYEQARQQATRYEGTILKKAMRNLELNRQSYEGGDTSYLGVLTAQRSYSQARLAWLNALEQLWSATVQIEGMLLRDSLE